MTIRPLRLLTVAAALLALALPAAGIAAPRDKPVDQGVVQSIGPTQIVLRALDGIVLSFSVSPDTRVRLNGTRASVDEIAPGFVASVYHDRRARAVLIVAFGTPVTSTDRGVVTALTRTAITLRTPGGASLTLSLNRETRFRSQGLPARRFTARPGALVAVTHAADAPALVVNVLKRAGA